MAKLLEKTRKITSILKRSEEQLQDEMPYNAIARQLADIIHCLRFQGRPPLRNPYRETAQPHVAKLK